MSLRDLEASDKQYALLEKLGYEIPKDGMSSGEASEKIKQLLGDKVKAPKDVTQNYNPAGGVASPSANKPQRYGSGTQNQDMGGTSRDVLIVRQSCLKAAVEVYGNPNLKDTPINTENILNLAEIFEKWVNR